MSDSEQPHPGPRRPARGRKLGRPARIDRAAIAEATHGIPMSELTLRSVAERLGVSVPSLYHYVSGRDDLFRLAAEQSVLRLALPVDHGQHWAVWFHEWAVYIRQAFVNDPGLLKQYIDGAIGIEVMAVHIDAALGLCVRQGFAAGEAMRAYDLVSECALGAAVTQIRDDAARARGRALEFELRRIIDRAEQPLPHLELLVAQSPLKVPTPFDEQITTVLIGIARERGEPVDEITVVLKGLAVPGAAG